MTDLSSKRPLSPHLQIYKPQITSTLSILHRATGVILTLATVLFIAGIALVATGMPMFETIKGLLGTKWGMLALFLASIAMNFHFCAGVRHLVLDAGHGFDKAQIYKSGYAMLAGTAIMTAVLWFVALGGM